MSPVPELPEPETAAGSRGEADEGYVQALFAREDDALRSIREAMRDEGLPTIQLPAATARVVQLLLRAVGARKVLEVGTLAGYSALWIARALPAELEGGDGLVTFEIDPARAALARRLLADAGVGGRVEVREADARVALAELGPDGRFDAVLLDADKEGLPGYLQQARRLVRRGGLVLVDNALWKGRVAAPEETDEATEAIRRSHRMVAEDPGFDATLLPVGDGLLVALRR